MDCCPTSGLIDVRRSGFEVLGVPSSGFFDPWFNADVDKLSLELVFLGMV